MRLNSRFRSAPLRSQHIQRRDGREFRPRLERLEDRRVLNGALDTTFDSDGQAVADFGGSFDSAHAVAQQPDGKLVVVGGNVPGGSNPTSIAVARFNTDGSPDDGTAADSTPGDQFGANGKVLIGSNGTVLSGANLGAANVAVQADGKIVLVGSASQALTGDILLMRLNSDGSLDGSFGTGGIVTRSFGFGRDSASAVTLQGDGKIVVAGSATINSALQVAFAVLRYNTDGTLDTQFSGDGTVTNRFGLVNAFAADVALHVDPAGVLSIVAVGFAIGATGPSLFAVARYDANGNLDASFGGDGEVTTSFSPSDLLAQVAVQPDGKIVAVGQSLGDGAPLPILARYNHDGTRDSSFGAAGNGIVPAVPQLSPGTRAPGTARAVVLQPDGKIVVGIDGGIFPPGADPELGGGIFGAFLARYNADGRLDDDGPADITPGDHFGTLAILGVNGFVYCVFPNSSTPDYPNGTPVLTSVRDLHLQPDGTIVAAGDINSDIAVARYESVIITNRPPVAVDDPRTTAVDIAIAIAVLSNDSDPDGDPLRVASVSSPAHGAAGISDNGTPANPSDDYILYTPQARFRGTDTFTYTIDDGRGGAGSATVTIVVDGPLVTDLVIIRSDLPDLHELGQDLTWTFHVTNRGPDEAGDVVLTDSLPAGTEVVSVIASQGSFLQTGDALVFDLGTLAAGATATITVVVLPATHGTFAVRAEVASSAPDSDLSNNTAADETRVYRAGGPSDVAVRIDSYAPDPIQFANRITFTLTVLNNGPNPALDVFMSYTESSGLRRNFGIFSVFRYEVIQAPAGVRAAFPRFPPGDLYIDSLPAGEQVVVALTWGIHGEVGTAAGLLPFIPLEPATLEATVVSSTLDPVLENNSATMTTRTTAGGDLSIAITTPQVIDFVEETLTATITVTNHGPDVAANLLVVMTDPIGVFGHLLLSRDFPPLPPGVSHAYSLFATSPEIELARNGQGFYCPALESGTQAVFTVGYRLRAPLLPPDSLIFTAQVSSGTPESDPTNNTASSTTLVGTGGDLAIEITHYPDTPHTGQFVSQTVTVTNHGPYATDALAVLVPPVPPGLRISHYVPIIAPSGQFARGRFISGEIVNGVRIPLLARFEIWPSGEQLIMDITYEVSEHAPMASLTFTASVSSLYNDPDHTNNADSAQITIADSDLDGVIDQAENRAFGTGDVNGDGVLDSLQGNVTSLPLFRSVDFEIVPDALTLVSEADTSLRGVNWHTGPLPQPSPPGLSLPLGLFGFEVHGLTLGAATQVTLLPRLQGTFITVNTYFQYGATADDPTPHWYEFLFDGTTGAEIFADHIVLHFVDGQRGDHDLTANGVIVDPGGPAFAPIRSVQSVTINDGSAQRSKVNSLTVRFDGLVTVDPGAFVLLRDDGRHVGLNVALSEIDGRTVAVLTFYGRDVIGGSLADGEYTLVARADRIHDRFGNVLDGDHDGLAGGDYRDEFFRRFGDGDGDDDVDRFDLGLFLSSFGRRANDPDYLWYFDYEADGRVFVSDLVHFLLSQHRRGRRR